MKDSSFTEISVPSVEEVEQISLVNDPVLRNLMITNCYSDLSRTIRDRTGNTANWCTFATWASLQAGESIRKQDLRNKMEEMLCNDPQVLQVIDWIAWFASNSGAVVLPGQIRQLAIVKMVSSVTDKTASAVARGNKKVFEEIGKEFARFIALCLPDLQYDEAHIAEFCDRLRPGDPPDGQQFLKNAFKRYYRSLFEHDVYRQHEQRFLANVEIGFHEQTRLQPEIAESLNAATIDADIIYSAISALLSRRTGFLKGLMFTLKLMTGKSDLLKMKIHELVQVASERLRRVITAELMTITLPPSNCIQLGRDLSVPFPECLQQLHDPELLSILTRIDKTPNSLSETGAVDWSDLNERMHFIADFFRCYHSSSELFTSAFTAAEADMIRNRRLPDHYIHH